MIGRIIANLAEEVAPPALDSARRSDYTGVFCVGSDGRHPLVSPATSCGVNYSFCCHCPNCHRSPALHPAVVVSAQV